LEEIPAYKRRESPGSLSRETEITEPSKNKIEERDGMQHLGTDNAFIHQTQD
jgi:hypothetical protein